MEKTLLITFVLIFLMLIFAQEDIIEVTSQSISISNSEGCVDYTFEAKNISDKVIELVQLSVQAYNSDDDPISERNTIYQITGPFPPGKSYSKIWYCEWPDLNIEYTMIEYINIIFTDGSEVLITDTDILNP